MSIIPLPRFKLTSLGKAQRIVLVDGNNIAWRSWHAKHLSALTHNGKKTGHVHGFMHTVLAYLRKSPLLTAVVIATDGYPKHKYEAFPEYKGSRSSVEDRAASGDPLPDITRLLPLLPFYHLHDADQEADDVIAGFIHRFRRRESLNGRSTPAKIVLVSGDHDMLQLMTVPDLVVQPTPTAPPVPVSDIAGKLYSDFKGAADAPALGPEHIVLWKSVFGDSSDTIPGVPRLLRKPVAAYMATTDGRLAQFLAGLPKSGLTSSIIDRIEANTDLIRRNWRLVQLSVIRKWPKRSLGNKAALLRVITADYGCVKMTEDLTRLF